MRYNRKEKAIYCVEVLKPIRIGDKQYYTCKCPFCRDKIILPCGAGDYSLIYDTERLRTSTDMYNICEHYFTSKMKQDKLDVLLNTLKWEHIHIIYYVAIFKKHVESIKDWWAWLSSDK